MDIAGDCSHKSSTRKVPQVVSFSEGFNMFHHCQESSAMLNELGRRNLACYDQKRRSEMNRARFFFQHVPRSLPRLSLPSTIRLMMEVQSGDFSSLLGQREAWSVNDSVAEIMRDTGCMIQFSDQRSAVSTGRVNNQVVITGAFPNIDEAQRRLRLLSPITIAIPLKNAKTTNLPNKNLSVCLTKWCAEGGELACFSKIQFNVAQPPQWLTHHYQKGPFLVIRGSYCDHEAILKASDKIQLLLFDGIGQEDFCARMEIPLLHRRWIVGSPDGVLIRMVSALSSCTIHFPTSNRSHTATSYFFSGSAKAVVSAVKMFYSISPVRMEFDIDNCQLKQPIVGGNREKKRDFDRFDIEHNVIVTMRKSSYEGEIRLANEDFRHLICLMTSEENLSSMYVVRRKMLSEAVWTNERTPPKRRGGRPQFVEYLRVLFSEASEKRSSHYSKNIGGGGGVKNFNVF